jgi:hypothetical protein
MGIPKVSTNGKVPRNRISKKSDRVDEIASLMLRAIKANQFISRTEMTSRMYDDCFSEVDEACGYPREIKFQDYKYMYDRDGIASRVVSLYPWACWGVTPYVFEREDIEVGKKTKFEKAWEDLVENHNILSKLYELDEKSGIGCFGLALVGMSESGKLDTRAYKVDVYGKPKDTKPAKRKLLYFSVFDEGDVRIESVEENPGKARYGKPVYYQIKMASNKKGDYTIGSEQRVHWTRCIHVPSDGGPSNDVFGPPRQQRPWNYLMNLRKIYGGSGQMFWNGGFPGTAFQVPSELAGQVELDKKALKKEIEEYLAGFKRYLALEGVEANQLMPNIADPKPHVEIELEAVCIAMQCPMRIFKGTEEARLASMQDTGNFHNNVKLRLTTRCTPRILRPTVDLFMATGIMPYVDKYYTSYPDLDATSEKDKADIAAKLIRALTDYMKGGVAKLIPPLEMWSMIMNYTPEEAEHIVKSAEKAAKSKKYKYLFEPTDGELKMSGKHPDQLKAAAKMKMDTRPRNTSTGRRPASGTTRKVKQR